MTTIILAAGLSSRMGENKLLLPFRGKPILLHGVQLALSASDRVIVVVGHEKEKVEEMLRNLDVDLVENPDFEKGQKTSVLCGIAAVRDDDFMIIPGDLPLLDRNTLEEVSRRLESSTAARAFYGSTPGHPVAFRKENRDEILSHPGTMKEYLAKVGLEKVQASLGSIYDVDTPEKYRALADNDGDLAALQHCLD